MKKQSSEYQQAVDLLHRLLKPGDTLHTILRNVSRSGMTRTVETVILKTENGNVIDIHPDHAISTVIGVPRAKDGSLKVGGCGMDSGFLVTYELACALFPKGFGCIGEGCPSNDHSNGDLDYTPNQVVEVTPELPLGVNTHWHNDGGYALKHRWL